MAQKIASGYKLYNSIGDSYDATRQADKNIVSILIKHLALKKEDNILDIGCGSGNYTVALHNNGINIEGLDYSETMLQHARNKNAAIKYQLGDSCSLPYNDARFNGTLFLLSTHHIHNLSQALQEAFRVIDRGRCLIMTATPEQMYSYWLWEYFPDMMRNGSKLMKSYEDLSALLSNAGFTNIYQDKFFVTNELQDLFLGSGKYRPEIYLDPTVRRNISSFHVSANTQEVHSGLEKLKSDITSGAINQIIAKYESEIGDYSFIIAEKT